MYSMPVAEALILRTWPVREADLIVSFFTREQGKLKGVAKSGAKSRKRFGGALEPMTRVLATYVERPRQELVRLDSCEIVASPLADPVDYARAAALALFAEVLEVSLQDHDPQDAIFRLTLAVLEQTRTGCVWLPATYFSLWMMRLMGWMPEIACCTVCRRAFADGAAYFEVDRDGLFCSEHRSPTARIVSGDSLADAARIFRESITVLSAEEWPHNRAADLRRFAIQALERHLERRLRPAEALRRLASTRSAEGVS